MLCGAGICEGRDHAVACSCYSWKNSALRVPYSKRGKGVQQATSFYVDLEVFWDHQQRNLPVTDYKNTGSALSTPCRSIL